MTATSPPEPPLVLVTGATGLLGSELVRILLDEGYRVRIFRRESSPLEALGALAEKVEHAVGDLTDPWSLKDAMQGVQAVFHVAAKITGAPPEALQAVNIQGTAHVVDSALSCGVERLVHTSSIAALGRPSNHSGLIDEKTEWADASARTPYGRSKRAAELEVFRGIAEGLDAVIVNPGFIFGIGRSGENTRLIVDLVRSGWAKAAPAGGTCFVDARDTASGLLRAYRLGDQGERYILGSENLTWRDALGTLAEAFGRQPPRFTIPPAAAKAVALGAEGLSTLARRGSSFNRSLARTMSSTYRYKTTKARIELGCTFRPFAKTAAHIADLLGEST